MFIIVPKGNHSADDVSDIQVQEPSSVNCKRAAAGKSRDNVRKAMPMYEGHPIKNETFSIAQ